MRGPRGMKGRNGYCHRLALALTLVAFGWMVPRPAVAEDQASTVADPVLERQSKAAEDYNRGLQLGGAGDWTGAVAAFQQALQSDPEDSDAHFQLAEAYRALNRIPDAMAQYKEAIRTSPTDGEAQLSLGVLEDQQGAYADAIKPLKMAVALLPNNPKAGAELGVALMNTQDYDGAIVAFRQVLRLAPREPTALYLIGWCYNGLGQYAEAIEPFRQSLALDHTAATVPSELGYAYRQLKRYPEAKVVYAQALEIDPKFAPALHGLGLTALALGDKVAAQQQLQILNGLDKTWADKLGAQIRNYVPSTQKVSYSLQRHAEPRGGHSMWWILPLAVFALVIVWIVRRALSKRAT
jgi:tetratricopeptide (TPR) repeat protein